MGRTRRIIDPIITGKHPERFLPPKTALLLAVYKNFNSELMNTAQKVPPGPAS